jgi:hypothetical protein
MHSDHSSVYTRNTSLYDPVLLSWFQGMSKENMTKLAQAIESRCPDVDYVSIFYSEAPQAETHMLIKTK